MQAAITAVRAMGEADLPAEAHTRRSIPEEYHRPRQGGPMMSQPTFNWKAPDRYVELLNFEMKVADVLQAEAYDLSEEGKVPIIKNWLGIEGLQLYPESHYCRK